MNAVIARQHRVLVERAQARPALRCGTARLSLVKSSLTRSFSHPVPLDMNTLAAHQALAVGPRSLPVAGLPDLPAPRSAAPHLEVRCTASSERTLTTPATSNTVLDFRRKVLRELKKIKMGLAGPELHHGSEPPDPASLDTSHHTPGSPATGKLGAQSSLLAALQAPPYPSKGARPAETRSWGFLQADSKFSADRYDPGKFSTLSRATPPRQFFAVTGYPPGNSSLLRATPTSSKEQVVKETSSRSDEPVDNSLKTKEKPTGSGGLTPPAKHKTKTFPLGKELKKKDLRQTAVDRASEPPTKTQTLG